MRLNFIDADQERLVLAEQHAFVLLGLLLIEQNETKIVDFMSLSRYGMSTKGIDGFCTGLWGRDEAIEWKIIKFAEGNEWDRLGTKGCCTTTVSKNTEREGLGERGNQWNGYRTFCSFCSRVVDWQVV